MPPRISLIEDVAVLFAPPENIPRIGLHSRAGTRGGGGGDFLNSPFMHLLKPDLYCRVKEREGASPVLQGEGEEASIRGRAGGRKMSCFALLY